MHKATERPDGRRISVLLEKLAPGRYTVQAVVSEAGQERATFGRSYFALRLSPAPAAAPAKPGE